MAWCLYGGVFDWLCLLVLLLIVCIRFVNLFRLIAVAVVSCWYLRLFDFRWVICLLYDLLGILYAGVVYGCWLFAVVWLVGVIWCLGLLIN